MELNFYLADWLHSTEFYVKVHLKYQGHSVYSSEVSFPTLSSRVMISGQLQKSHKAGCSPNVHLLHLICINCNFTILLIISRTCHYPFQFVLKAFFQPTTITKKFFAGNISGTFMYLPPDLLIFKEAKFSTTLRWREMCVLLLKFLWLHWINE